MTMSRRTVVGQWFKSPWVIVGMALQSLAFPLGYYVFWQKHLWFDWMMPIANFVNPDKDPPDNWAVAAEYSFRLIAGLLMAGLGCYCVALWRLKGKSAQPAAAGHAGTRT